MIETRLLELLLEYGPPLLFAMAFLETSFVTGLFVPSGVATSVATVLAIQGSVDLVPMLLAAGAGGALGDSTGFWIGKWSGERILASKGPWARRLGLQRKEFNALYGRHPIYSVTGARLFSFVRTLMPMAAGMSGLKYRKFLPYELAGLIGWLGIYVAIGFLAQDGWETATRVVGVGGTLAFIAVGIVLWNVLRRARRAQRARRTRAAQESDV